MENDLIGVLYRLEIYVYLNELINETKLIEFQVKCLNRIVPNN